MIAGLRNIDFKCLLHDKNANESMQMVHTVLLNCIDTVSPECEFSVSLNKTHCEPWVTKGLRKCTHKQLKLYKASLFDKSTECQEKYKQYRVTLKRIKR